MWEIYSFQNENFVQNPFLIGLKSIADDLGKNKYAALKSFKEIRNAIEHKIIFITENENEFPIEVLTLNKRTFEVKTEILLNLTKSAIFCYTYFFRHLSKSIK